MFKIQPDKFFFTQKGVLKFYDFSFGTRFFDSEVKSKQFLSGGVIYLAPDCIQNGIYDLDTDYWSLGILLIYLIDGKTPLEGKN